MAHANFLCVTFLRKNLGFNLLLKPNIPGLLRRCVIHSEKQKCFYLHFVSATKYVMASHYLDL
ncbi:unnamed protein product [Acanthoscelides obtectus]|uniref:Uncharacterized protein n=1 Tax=Acanthoscelides obtectus TaxID=200917 RepID=A0A9P0JZH2_ACAOB|nr:unnamed protein product [Acanthoscelides obtectus]CAK1621962.1 hypothetical protein AOBTE_LOCUS1237 [Acanthoscelides obtectus]